ncbi:MAG: VOC family protein [Candidatus Thorarchaeota archaeon]
MYIEHIAITSNSEQDSDKFFCELLGLEKVREFIVSADLMELFFNIKKDQKVIRYENNQINLEVFINNDQSGIKDKFKHICIVVENKLKFIEKAEVMGYNVIKVARKDNNDFYLFLKDNLGNLYEIKSS